MAESGVRFEGESSDYRLARRELLEAEKRLRAEVEKVAALRRSLPDGHPVTEDYAFTEVDLASGERRTTRLSELFVLPDRSLLVYNFMYGEGASPCPMCTAFLDSFDRVVPHAGTRANLAVVAKGPVDRLEAHAKARGWRHLRLLSSGGTDFNRTYKAEAPDGSQLPMVNVFRRRNGEIRHFYSTELFFEPTEPGQHPRHVDPIFPLWNVLDLTAEGRGDFFPKLSY